MDNSDKIRDFIHKHKFIIPLFLVLFIGIIIFLSIYLSTNGFYKAEGGYIETEYDSQSGQTIEKIVQEEEGETKKDGPELIGFNTYINYGYTINQYNILIDTIRTYFKDNKSNISRVSYVIDSIKYDNEKVSILRSDIVDNLGNHYTLSTDTKNTVDKLLITITDSNNQELIRTE